MIGTSGGYHALTGGKKMRTRRKTPIPRAAIRRRRPRLDPNRTSGVIAPSGALAGLPGVGPPAIPGAAAPMAARPGMPMMKKGGKVKKTGPHMLHKGEKVVPAHKAKRPKK